MYSQNAIGTFETPQLDKIHMGKVRESFRIDADRRLIVATDRISCFDKVLRTLIPGKGAVLTGIANYWFERTRHIVPNHILATPHPQAIVAKEATPIRVEMIVRGYISGSLWMAYEKGQREFYGEKLPDGLTKNQKLPVPMITPTTKDECDRPISAKEIVANGLASQDLYDQMAAVVRSLFAFGNEELAKRNIILADAKYEFGLVDGVLVLIDEIHTPDCARFWDAKSYVADPLNPQEFDKEFVRRWLRANTEKDASMPLFLPADVVLETQKRYLTLYKMITGEDLSFESLSNEGLAQALVRQQFLKPGFVVIFMGSRADLEHAENIASHLADAGVYIDMRVVSAHKNGERLLEITKLYNVAAENGVGIAIAGLSNGLGGALAASLNIPVINCPPFKDSHDLAMNINSSLMMPSGVPALTVVGTNLAAEAALRCLNLPSLRRRADQKRAAMKNKLLDDDVAVRSQIKAMNKIASYQRSEKEAHV